MEYSQTPQPTPTKTPDNVLILILMEYSQTFHVRCILQWFNVLILILMEYSQTGFKDWCNKANPCLNPYSNGILTDKWWRASTRCSIWCLNPYSNVILTDEKKLWDRISWLCVLILILMEYSQTSVEVEFEGKNYSLNPYSNGILTDFSKSSKNDLWTNCLNPYSNGILTDVEYHTVNEDVVVS